MPRARAGNSTGQCRAFIRKPFFFSFTSSSKSNILISIFKRPCTIYNLAGQLVLQKASLQWASFACPSGRAALLQNVLAKCLSLDHVHSLYHQFFFHLSTPPPLEIHYFSRMLIIFGIILYTQVIVHTLNLLHHRLNFYFLFICAN